MPARSASRCPFFFFNDTATTEIYTLSLHDALPISLLLKPRRAPAIAASTSGLRNTEEARFLSRPGPDRKSTRLNSSHLVISYAVFCLKKKKRNNLAVAGSETRYLIARAEHPDPGTP